MSEQSSGVFDSTRLKGRVREKAQRAVASLMESGEEIVAMVPGRSAGPERKHRSLSLTRHKLVVATQRHVYVFGYRFGRVKEIALKQVLGALPVTVHDETRGGGYMTIGDLSLRIGASVWRDWRDEARRIVELNYGAA